MGTFAISPQHAKALYDIETIKDLVGNWLLLFAIFWVDKQYCKKCISISYCIFIGCFFMWHQNINKMYEREIFLPWTCPGKTGYFLGHNLVCAYALSETFISYRAHNQFQIIIHYTWTIFYAVASYTMKVW